MRQFNLFCLIYFRIFFRYDSFSPQDLAALTRDLCNNYPEVPLPSQGIEVCLSALKFLVKALKGEVTCEGDEMRERVESDGRKSSGNDNASEETNTVKNCKSKDTLLSKKIKEAPLKLEDLLPIFMPDRTGVLSSSFSLTVDDAPWISSALNQRNSTVKFVHSKPWVHQTFNRVGPLI